MILNFNNKQLIPTKIQEKNEIPRFVLYIFEVFFVEVQSFRMKNIWLLVHLKWVINTLTKNVLVSVRFKLLVWLEKLTNETYA